MTKLDVNQQKFLKLML